MLARYEVKKAIEEGLALEMCKFKRDGEWSAWKAVSAEVASHKVDIRVCPGFDADYDDPEDEEWFSPYGFRLANPEEMKIIDFRFF